MSRFPRLFRRKLAALLLLPAACALPPSALPPVPAPAGYAEATIHPFADDTPLAAVEHPPMLYATDRQPAASGSPDFYSADRGDALRLGIGHIEGPGRDDPTSWADARRVALLKDHVEAYPLRVAAVEEFGVVADSLSPVASDALREAAGDAAMTRFIDVLNERLRRSPHRDVIIFVHGYKVGFDNPLLVASEFWHYLAYNGAFIAYAWPTSEQVWSYPASAESAVNSARHLRLLVREIARRSDARRIHILAYSAGTRLVMRTLTDLGQQAGDRTSAELRRRLKIDNVILVSSDLDRDVFSGYLRDGALRIPETLSLYQYADDGALDAAATLFGRKRLGQPLEADAIDDRAATWLQTTPQLRLIDVADAPGVAAGNGHRYLRTSPWVSADILMSLLYDLTPDQRGLQRRDEDPVWRFPADYPARLQGGLEDAGARPFRDLDARGRPQTPSAPASPSGTARRNEERIE